MITIIQNLIFVLFLLSLLPPVLTLTASPFMLLIYLQFLKIKFHFQQEFRVLVRTILTHVNKVLENPKIKGILQNFALKLQKKTRINISEIEMAPLLKKEESIDRAAAGDS